MNFKALVVLSMFLFISNYHGNSWNKLASLPLNQSVLNLEEQRVDSILSNFYTIYSANFDEAIQLTTQARKLSVKNNWPEKEAQSLMYNGIANGLRGNYEAALTSYFLALEIFERLNNLSGLARLYNEMSVIYRHLGNVKRTFEALDKAEKAAIVAGDLEQLGTNYGMRGNILTKSGNLDSAQTYFQKVMAIRLQLNDSVGLGYILLDYANYHFAKGNIGISDDYIKQSTDIRINLNDLQGVAENEQLIGTNFFKLENYTQAISHFFKSNEIAQSVGYLWLMRQNHDWLQLCYANLKDYEAAYLNELKYRQFNDSLFNISKSKAIEELQTKYDTEKKDRQIQMLDQDNNFQKAVNQRNTVIIITLIISVLLLLLIFYLWRQRSRANQKEVLNEQKIRLREAQIQAVINSEEKERKRFASDLHDSMGQLVSALTLNIQGLKNANGDSAVRNEIVDNSTSLLNDIQREIRNIAFNLMPHILTNEGLIAAINELSNRINKSNQVKVIVHTFGINKRFNDVFEISLYRILQEWISNVLKYAKATEILIQFTAHEHEMIITVEDDGTGFDLESFEASKGNGWRNINSRLNLIKGTMDIDTQPGRKNTTLTLTINNVTAYQVSQVALNT